ncbi:hypothetical protein W822_14080 [Advenella kashmirensis W13003]|uniref:Uncharacterized protein n=1 Tax=Advenella kashmirensis W13003 TaxID=1424334 RepID=V8QSR1_9BURK|nr:hypothetical protein W822_14080 [Advenella kashmirensis W13003]
MYEPIAIDNSNSIYTFIAKTEPCLLPADGVFISVSGACTKIAPVFTSGAPEFLHEAGNFTKIL